MPVMIMMPGTRTRRRSRRTPTTGRTTIVMPVMIMRSSVMPMMVMMSFVMPVRSLVTPTMMIMMSIWTIRSFQRRQGAVLALLLVKRAPSREEDQGHGGNSQQRESHWNHTALGRLFGDSSRALLLNIAVVHRLDIFHGDGHISLVRLVRHTSSVMLCSVVWRCSVVCLLPSFFTGLLPLPVCCCFFQFYVLSLPRLSGRF
jgi:hypothetical protein